MVVCEKVARIWEWCLIDKIDKFQDQTTHGGFFLYNKNLNSKLTPDCPKSSRFLPIVRPFLSMKVFFNLSEIFWDDSLLYSFEDAKKFIPLGHGWAMLWPFSSRQDF